MDTLPVFLSLVITVLSLAYIFVNKKFKYWEKKNVAYATPLPVFGNYSKFLLFQEYQGQLVQKLCHQFPDRPYFGAFYGMEPVLVVQSPELLKQIFTKDFHYFNGREVSNYDMKEILTQSLFFTSGDNWKLLRHNLSPLFSTGKLKNMFHIIKNCSHMLEDVLHRETSACNVIEAKHLSARFTMDCICSFTFGIESNTLSQPENNAFNIIAESIFEVSTSRSLRINCRSVWPAIFYGLGFQCFPDSIITFFSQMMQGVFESRNHKPTSRNDFVDLVLSLKEKYKENSDVKTGLDEKVPKNLEYELLVSQAVALFSAGFETSAGTLSFILYELAKHPKEQRRAADEVDKFLRSHDNQLDYESINELTYLDACLYETLRIYPVLGVLTREVMEDFTFGDGLRLEKRVRIHIPVYELHHNPVNFPEPQVFKPERFLPGNRESIIPYSFLPYGEGPRICIGKRLSKLQVLPALVSILKTYRVELADGMPETVTFEPRTMVTQPKNQGIMLKFTKREGWEQRTFVRS